MEALDPNVLPQTVLGRGWQARLDLGFAGDPALPAARTRLVRRSHFGPLRVQRPFYPDGPVCNVYIVHPPGGVVGGDRLDLRISAERAAQVLLTTPAAGKFYRSAGPEARQRVEMRLQDGATLEWLPQETIHYPGALVRQQTLVRLDTSARFIGWDLAAYGLPARDERYDSGRVVQGFELWRGEQPLLLDRLLLQGGGAAFGSRWGLDGATALGTFVACPATADDLGAARDAVAPLAGVSAGLSLVDGVLIGRVLARQTDAAMRALLALWRALRPRLLGRPAVLPRIWAT